MGVKMKDVVSVTVVVLAIIFVSVLPAMSGGISQGSVSRSELDALKVRLERLESTVASQQKVIEEQKQIIEQHKEVLRKATLENTTSNEGAEDEDDWYRRFSLEGGITGIVMGTLGDADSVEDVRSTQDAS